MTWVTSALKVNRARKGKGRGEIIYAQEDRSDMSNIREIGLLRIEAGFRFHEQLAERLADLGEHRDIRREWKRWLCQEIESGRLPLMASAWTRKERIYRQPTKRNSR